MTPYSRNVSIVIPVYNGAEVIGRQLAALVPQLESGDEVVVVDNRSTDETAAVVRKAAGEESRVRLVSAFDRQGVNHARNIGALAARTERILFIDADDAADPGWLSGMRDALDRGDLAAGLTRVTAPDGHVITTIGAATVFDHLPYPIGCNMGVTADAFRAIGGFDETFVGGHDEVDFAWRLQYRGFTLVDAPAAQIAYIQRSTALDAFRQHRRFGQTSILLWVRHQDRIRPGAVSLKAALLRAVRAVPLAVRVHLRAPVRYEEATAAGWVIGVLFGHLRYRVLKRVPAPLLATAPELSVPQDGR